MKLERILYAEDEPDIQSVAKLALEVLGGYDVLLCSNGTDVLEQVCGFDPSLILLDVMMPDLDGLATLQRLRGDPNTANIPVIFFTAKAQNSEVRYYQALGALDVISKPFAPMQLATQVQKIWDRSHG
jgi:two-component system, OmpR family, response regulator